MAITKLVAGVDANDASGSTGAQVANAVNALIDEVTVGSELDQVMAFQPINWGGWVAQTSYNGLIYGRKSSDPLNVYTSGLDLAESVLGQPVPAIGVGTKSIRFVFVLDEQNILVMVEDSDLLYRIYKTSDRCETWSLVFTSQHTNVRALSDRSILKATINNQTVLFYAEYNINTAGNDGISPEAKLVLWKSVDYGTTWTAVVSWNELGVNNTRHMHCAKQFKPNSHIYICFGDTDAQSAIVRWDGVTPWPSNTSWQNITQSEGLKLFYGRQAARALDLVECDGKVYYLNDTYTSQRGDATEQAVWSFNDDTFDGFTNEAQPQSSVKNQAGWMADKTADGRLLFICAPDALAYAGSKYVGVIASNLSKTNYKVAGAYRTRDNITASVPTGFMHVNGTIFLSATGGSGKGADNTAAFKVSDYAPFMGEYETKFIPDTIHPVYWVDSVSGDDLNTARKPSVPAKEFRSLIAGDKVPYGARIQLVRTDNEFTGATITWKSNAVSGDFQGDITEPVSIYGQGALKTSLYYAADGAITTSVFSVSGANVVRARFVDLSVYTKKSLRLFDVSQSAGQDNELSFVRCIVGSPTVLSSALVRMANAPVSAYGSIIGLNRDSNTFLTTLSVNDLLNLTLDHCLMLSSNTHVSITNEATGNNIRLYNVKSFGYGVASISISGAASATVAGWNNVMSTAYLTNAGAFIGGGTITGKFQNSAVRGVANNTTAFADNCKIGLPVRYNFKYSDYVY